jgi:ubiquinone biosynthesis protein UbiJ
MTPVLVCAALEIALNRYLQLENAVLKDCAALTGKRIALHASDLGWTFAIGFHPGGVWVAAETDGPPPEVRVEAPLLRLLHSALRAAEGTDPVAAGLQVEGDTELLRRFNALLARVGFDPEELMARAVGEGAAHRLVGGLRGLFGWGRHAVRRLSQDTAEYLAEETGDLASAADVEEWMQSVDALREGTDRFEARLALLERRANGEISAKVHE